MPLEDWKPENGCELEAGGWYRMGQLGGDYLGGGPSNARCCGIAGEAQEVPSSHRAPDTTRLGPKREARVKSLGGNFGIGIVTKFRRNYLFYRSQLRQVMKLAVGAFETGSTKGNPPENHSRTPGDSNFALVQLGAVLLPSCP